MINPSNPSWRFSLEEYFDKLDLTAEKLAIMADVRIPVVKSLCMGEIKEIKLDDLASIIKCLNNLSKAKGYSVGFTLDSLIHYYDSSVEHDPKYALLVKSFKSIVLHTSIVGLETATLAQIISLFGDGMLRDGISNTHPFVGDSMSLEQKFLLSLENTLRSYGVIDRKPSSEGGYVIKLNDVGNRLYSILIGKTSLALTENNAELQTEDVEPVPGAVEELDKLNSTPRPMDIFRKL